MEEKIYRNIKNSKSILNYKYMYMAKIRDNVIKFPDPAPKTIQGYRMSFYTEKEIDLALLCLNVY